ncbi:hypothetical protein MYX04_09750 [Nitrospiraceae bacterium AH_259_D15_M11_P09]|nr:hypothetical protein [Nitrospiraceae bacterium AH_259_D15_M11_P09]
METIIEEHACECKPYPIAKLRQLLAQLSDADRATVWEGVALAVGEQQHGSKE